MSEKAGNTAPSPGLDRYNRVQAKLAEVRKSYNESQLVVDDIYRSLRKNKDDLDKIVPDLTMFCMQELNKIDVRADRSMNKVERASTPEMGWDMFIDENWFNMCCDMLMAQVRGIYDFETNHIEFCKAWDISP